MSDKDELEPTEAMCDAARGFILGLEVVGDRNYENMRKHLRKSGQDIPAWMADRSGHITKWDVADCIYRLMISASTPNTHVRDLAKAANDVILNYHLTCICGVNGIKTCMGCTLKNALAALSDGWKGE